MRFWWFLAGLMLANVALPAAAQDMMSDVLAGKLVHPAEGVYAWYDLKDNASGKTFLLRQAIVGREKAEKDDAYWVETEIVPPVGFPSVYKMLLVGPASDPKNIKRMIVREGDLPAREMPMDAAAAEKTPKPEEAKKESLGKETIETAQKSLETEHLSVVSGDKSMELWVNETVPPMGLVRMRSKEGELTLKRWGQGGPDGESAIKSLGADPATSAAAWKVEAKKSEKASTEGEAKEDKKSKPKGRAKTDVKPE